MRPSANNSLCMAVLSAPNACFLNPAALPRGCLAEPLTLVFTPSVAANRDDALWALDGLASGHDATTRDSLAALAEICATRRGRLALRSGSLAADVLAAAGRLAGGAGVACSACCCWLSRIACMLDLHSSKPISFSACPLPCFNRRAQGATRSGAGAGLSHPAAMFLPGRRRRHAAGAARCGSRGGTAAQGAALAGAALRAWLYVRLSSFCMLGLTAATAAHYLCVLRLLLLLQLSSSFEAAAAGGDASSCAAGAKLLALLRERPYSLQVRAQAASVPVPE